jgi:hypothetical protein
MDGHRNTLDGSSGQSGALLEISYVKRELQYVLFYNIILGLGMTTNSQYRFPAIHGGRLSSQPLM